MRGVFESHLVGGHGFVSVWEIVRTAENIKFIRTSEAFNFTKNL